VSRRTTSGKDWNVATKLLNLTELNTDTDDHQGSRVAYILETRYSYQVTKRVLGFAPWVSQVSKDVLIKGEESNRIELFNYITNALDNINGRASTKVQVLIILDDLGFILTPRNRKRVDKLHNKLAILEAIESSLTEQDDKNDILPSPETHTTQHETSDIISGNTMEEEIPPMVYLDWYKLVEDDDTDRVEATEPSNKPKQLPVIREVSNKATSEVKDTVPHFIHYSVHCTKGLFDSSC